MGEHEIASRDLERCIDFLDIRFKRKTIPWETKLYFDYSYCELGSRAQKRQCTVNENKTHSTPSAIFRYDNVWS